MPYRPNGRSETVWLEEKPGNHQDRRACTAVNRRGSAFDWSQVTGEGRVLGGSSGADKNFQEKMQERRDSQGKGQGR